MADGISLGRDSPRARPCKLNAIADPTSAASHGHSALSIPFLTILDQHIEQIVNPPGGILRIVVLDEAPAGRLRAGSFSLCGSRSSALPQTKHSFSRNSYAPICNSDKIILDICFRLVVGQPIGREHFGGSVRRRLGLPPSRDDRS
jgi:hypothetical protein